MVQLSGNPRQNDTYVPTGRIWPSGDFSLGYRRVEGDSLARLDLRSHRQRIDDGEMVPPGDDWELSRWGFPRPMVGAMTATEKAECDAWHFGGASAPLNLTDARNSHTPKNRPEKYGRMGITGYGRKMVRSGCALLDRMKNRRLTFATVTMPTLPKNQRRELAVVWPELVRQLVQWLTRQLERQGLPKLVVSTTEIQPGRLAENEEAYLHLHLVWPNHWAKAGNWAVDCCDARAWVEKFLLRRGLLPAGQWVNVNVQQVRKSAGAYLSKYLSKGSREIEAMAADTGWDSIPGQWWNMSAPLRAWVKSHVRQGGGVGYLLVAVVDYIFHTGDMDGFYSLRECTLEWEGREVGVGWCGVMSQDRRKDLCTMLDKAA